MLISSIARGRRPGEAEVVFFRRGAPLSTRPAREDRAGRAPDPLEGVASTCQNCSTFLSRCAPPETRGSIALRAVHAEGPGKVTGRGSCGRTRSRPNRSSPSFGGSARPSREKGRPNIVERAFDSARSRLGPLTDASARPRRFAGAGHYEKRSPRIRLREIERADRGEDGPTCSGATHSAQRPPPQPVEAQAAQFHILFGSYRPRGGQHDGPS
jgi:hypothetical protein